MVQYGASVNVSPYRSKGTGEELGVLVGWSVGGGVDVCDELCLDEHARRRIIKTRVSRNILVFTVKDVFIHSLLTDRVPQYTQPFDLHHNFITVLQFAHSCGRTREK
jgi:hypothetical protein